jgi:hypothetical protein
MIYMTQYPCGATDSCFRGTAIANLRWGRSPNFMAALPTSGLQRLTQTSATVFQTFPSHTSAPRSNALRCSGRRGAVAIPERRMDTEQYEMHDHMNVACDALAPAVPHHKSDIDCQCEHNNAAPTHLHSYVRHKLPGQPISRMAHTAMRYAQAS